MIQVAYTNSNCSDIWNMFFKQIDKFSHLPLCLISDQDMKYYPKKDIYIYDNNTPYYLTWTNALKKFNSDYFIYLQEDFILYKNIDNDKLNYCLEFLKNHPEYSFARLIKSGNLSSNQIADNLFEIEPSNQDVFSMQATIWRTEDYCKLLLDVKDNRWFETPKYRESAIKLGIKGLYYYEGETKRGLSHYDSNVYPYIATALVRGKWNISEYSSELLPLLKEYNIDFTIRGSYNE